MAIKKSLSGLTLNSVQTFYNGKWTLCSHLHLLRSAPLEMLVVTWGREHFQWVVGAFVAKHVVAVTVRFHLYVWYYSWIISQIRQDVHPHAGMIRRHHSHQSAGVYGLLNWTNDFSKSPICTKKCVLVFLLLLVIMAQFMSSVAS